MDDPLKPDDTPALDRLLADVAARLPTPSADFIERLVADAEAMRPPARRPPARPGLSGWLAALGGWPALGGGLAATLAGLWIGVAPPAALDGYLTGSVSVELLPDGLPLLEEG